MSNGLQCCGIARDGKTGLMTEMHLLIAACFRHLGTAPIAGDLVKPAEP
jgi:hypothetical protein